MNEIAEYLVESAVWAVVGFVGGYAIGRVAVTGRDDSTGADVTTDAPEPPPTRHRKGFTGQQMLGVVVVILALATVAQGLIQSAATRAVVTCQQEYSNGFADALDARTAASTAAQNSLDSLIGVVGHVIEEPPSPQAATEFAHAVTAYLNTRAMLKRQRQLHPYPPAPRDLCP
ncbi:MAG TPA: hypothetical protein VFW65_31960 [Pseudonocardiaceae bacterium]|nr:hypothetical protein [Pseudonocardiaceae bacterium]